jgi:hypothetical protein
VRPWIDHLSHWIRAWHPTTIGVAVGAIAGPEFPPPVRSVWEQSMHHWVTMPEGVQHFARGRVSA